MPIIEVRLYNSVRQAGRPAFSRMEVPYGVTVREIVRRLDLRSEAIYVAFKNGLPLGPGFAVAAETVVGDGDVVAFSGPVPFSWHYGAPLV
jgi:hypothetical protein